MARGTRSSNAMTYKDWVEYFKDVGGSESSSPSPSSSDQGSLFVPSPSHASSYIPSPSIGDVEEEEVEEDDNDDDTDGDDYDDSYDSDASFFPCSSSETSYSSSSSISDVGEEGREGGVAKPVLVSKETQLPHEPGTQNTLIGPALQVEDLDTKPAEVEDRTANITNQIASLCLENGNGKDTSTSDLTSARDETLKEQPKATSETNITREKVKEIQGTVTDLDPEDLKDPLMVAEYAEKINKYLKDRELTTMPKSYMDSHVELTWEMRGILIEWLIDIHAKFSLLPETLFLTVNIVDRFLSRRINWPKGEFQLLGCTAMFIASKYEEIYHRQVPTADFVTVSEKGFTAREILRTEQTTLRALGYDLSYPNPLNFLRRISKADSYDIPSRTFSKYLMEISLVDHRFLEYKPSLIAAAAMYLARLVLKRGAWVRQKLFSIYAEFH